MATTDAADATALADSKSHKRKAGEEPEKYDFEDVESDPVQETYESHRE